MAYLPSLPVALNVGSPKVRAATVRVEKARQAGKV
jgi:hypothetical protein